MTALRDTCPDNPRLREAVTEQGLSHTSVEPANQRAIDHRRDVVSSFSSKVRWLTVSKALLRSRPTSTVRSGGNGLSKPPEFSLRAREGQRCSSEGIETVLVGGGGGSRKVSVQSRQVSMILTEGQSREIGRYDVLTLLGLPGFSRGY